MSDMGFSFDAIDYIASIFEVSFEAAVRSLVESATRPIAVVFLAPGFSKAEKRQMQYQQLPFLEPYVPNPKLRVRRYYTSPGFPMRINQNKSAPDDCCATEAFRSDSHLNCNQELSFDDRSFYMVEIETKPRSFYVDGRITQGVLMLLSNPVRA